jgi:hypothetical protein
VVLGGDHALCEVLASGANPTCPSLPCNSGNSPEGKISEGPCALGFNGNHLEMAELQGSKIKQSRDNLAHKKWRVVKSKWGGVSLVVKEDLKVSQIAEPRGKTLIGGFKGRRVYMENMNLWMQYEWVLVLGYKMTIHLLARGWIGFIFQTQDDV